MSKAYQNTTKKKITTNDETEKMKSFFKNDIKQNNVLLIFFVIPFYSFFNNCTWQITVGFIFSLLGFSLFSTMLKSSSGTLSILLSIIFTVSYLMKLTSQKLVFGNLLAFVIILVLLNILMITFTLRINKIKNHSDERVESLNKYIKWLYKSPKFINQLIEYIKNVNPFFMYLLVVIIGIMVFGNIYGFEINELGSSKAAMDKYYFSAVTFFTVGYGDVTPVSSNSKIIAMIEMLYSSMTFAIFMPIIISIFMENTISKKQENGIKKESSRRI